MATNNQADIAEREATQNKKFDYDKRDFKSTEEALQHFFLNTRLSGANMKENWANYQEHYIGPKKSPFKVDYKHPTKEQFENFHKDQNAHQLLVELKRPHQFLPIYSKNDNSYQIDLTYVQEFNRRPEEAPVNPKGPFNAHKVKYVLTAIDVNSRFAYAIPIKGKEVPLLEPESKNDDENKESKEDDDDEGLTQEQIDAKALRQKDSVNVVRQLEKINEEVKQRTGSGIYSITSDLGGEFHSEYYQNWCREHGIQYYYANADDKTKMGKVERFHRTFKRYLLLDALKTNTNDWTTLVDDVMHRYNYVKKNQGMTQFTEKQYGPDGKMVYPANGRAPNKFNATIKEMQINAAHRRYYKLAGPKEEIDSKYPADQKFRVRVERSFMDKKAGKVTTSGGIHTFHKIYPSGTVELKDSTGNVVSDKEGPKRFKPYFILPIQNANSYSKEGTHTAVQNPQAKNYYIKNARYRKEVEDLQVKGPVLKKARISKPSAKVKANQEQQAQKKAKK